MIIRRGTVILLERSEVILSGEEVKLIRKDLGEVKDSIVGLTQAIADLRVLVAGEYVKKTDFGECKKNCEERIIRVHDKIDRHEKEETSNAFKLAGLVFTVAALVFGIIQWVVSLARLPILPTP